MLFSDDPLNIYEIEGTYRRDGFVNIVGIDEAGRGPLAGPVVAAAVALPATLVINGLDDSKKLSPGQRERLFDVISKHPQIRLSIGVISHAEIDRVNILRATHLAMISAASQLAAPVDLLLVDGLPVPNLPYPSRNLVKGDQRCACIAAASIVAKVHRDRLMSEFDDQFPEYGFRRHKGYGTKGHLHALAKFGPSPIHRRTFSPVSNLSMHNPATPALPLSFE